MDFALGSTCFVMGLLAVLQQWRKDAFSICRDTLRFAAANIVVTIRTVTTLKHEGTCFRQSNFILYGLRGRKERTKERGREGKGAT